MLTMAYATLGRSAEPMHRNLSRVVEVERGQGPARRNPKRPEEPAVTRRIRTLQTSDRASSDASGSRGGSGT